MAFILYLLTSGKKGKNKYRILALRKSIFSEDVESIKSVSSEFSLLNFLCLLLFEIERFHFKNFDELSDATYYPLFACNKEELVIRECIRSYFPKFKKLLHIDEIFAGSFV